MKTYKILSILAFVAILLPSLSLASDRANISNSIHIQSDAGSNGSIYSEVHVSEEVNGKTEEFHFSTSTQGSFNFNYKSSGADEESSSSTLQINSSPEENPEDPIIQNPPKEFGELNDLFQMIISFLNSLLS